jgi:hypothetical protein
MLVAEVSPQTRAQVGGRTRLSVDPGRLYFFDAATEELIAGPLQPASDTTELRGVL